MFTPLKNMKWTDWAQEYAAVLGSFASFIAMVALLAAFDGKVVGTWNGVTLNAVVSILSLIMRASLAYVLAKCLAQWKWVLFAREARPLIDFDRIDAVTRGPLGSLRVLARTKGPCRDTAAIGIDPFTQQLIQFRSGLFSEPSHAARIARSSRYTREYGSALVDMPLSMKTAVLTGLTRSPSELAQQVLVQCPTSNCTWPPFRTLGVCHRCTNVTTSLRRIDGIDSSLVDITGYMLGLDGPPIFNNSGIFPSTAYVLPNGHFIANVNAHTSNPGSIGRYTMTSFGTWNKSKTLTMKDVDTLIWSTSFIHPDVDAVNAVSWPVGADGTRLPLPLGDLLPNLPIWPEVPLQATECGLYYCVKAVNSSVEGNQLHENITEFSSKRDPASGDPSSPASFPDTGPDYQADLYITSPNASDPVFYVHQSPLNAISEYIQSLFVANYTDPYASPDPSLPRVRQEIDAILRMSGAVGLNGMSSGPQTYLTMTATPPTLDHLWTWTAPNVASTFDSLATSITNEMSRNDREDASRGRMTRSRSMEM
ncbi:hypothetical protein VE02_07869 [Pseudogymnoascus sp. 03VT05]|nr:hypothetical protein VE02_07869 [Pseudogymnoascus sp. 03VT05]